MSEVRTTSSTGGQKGTKIERFDLIPIGPLTELARHYGAGARKYDDNQWRKGYEWSKSYSALTRHLTAFWAGFDYDVCSNDPEGCKFTDADGNPFETGVPDTCFNHTGSHHMVAVAWHAFALLEFKDQYPEHDDRYRTDPVGFDGYSNAFEKFEEANLQPYIDEMEAAVRELARVAQIPPYAEVEWREPEVPTTIGRAEAWQALGLVPPIRFICGLETEDLDPLGFIQEAFKQRD